MGTLTGEPPMELAVDRRVACDRQVPSCLNCTKSNRKCLGYGVRLSWPRISDSKRAIVAMSSARSLPARGIAKHRSTLMLVHTSSRDIDMYYYLRKLRSGKCNFLSIFVGQKGGLRTDLISWLARALR
jgi:hypothetical protein